MEELDVMRILPTGYENYSMDVIRELFINLTQSTLLDNLTTLNTTNGYGTGSRDSMSVVIPITVFYGVIFIAGVLGNVITCTVISRNKSMHTATNYYLFNLAISDLLLLISGMPPEIYNIWFPTRYPFPQSFCILQGLLSETSTNATVLTITSFTVERYIAICHPFRQHTMSKLSRAVKFILAIWIVAFCLAIPQAIQFGVVDIGDGGACTVKNVLVEHAFEVSSFVFFVGPMTMICVLYVLIGVKLRKSKLLQGVKRRGCDFNRGISAQTRVIRMLVAVAVAFFLCWAPFHAQRLMAVYGSAVETSNDLFYKIYTALTYISGVLYFLSTCINPLLYNIMSHKFRDAFKSTLARHCGFGKKYQTQQNQNYSALSRCGGSLRLTTTINRNQYTGHEATGGHHIEKRESDLSLINGPKSGTNSCFRNHCHAPIDPYSSQNLIRNFPGSATIVPKMNQNCKLVDEKLPSCVNSFRITPSHCSNKSSPRHDYAANAKSPATVAIAVASIDPESPNLTSNHNKSSTFSSIADKLRRSTKKVWLFKNQSNSDDVPKNEKLKKNNSVESAHTNTISNSSLQEVDDEEFNSSELVKYMEEINNEIKS